MKGLLIFLHALRQVTRNLDSALKVSALPYAIQIVAGLILLGPTMFYGQGPDPSMAVAGGGMFASAMLDLVIALFTSVWIAVGWHRFILKNETPTGFVPAFVGRRNWAYFVRSFGIGLLCILAAFPLGMVGGLIAFPFFGEGGPGFAGIAIIFIVTYLPITMISYRLSTALPGCALDAQSAFGAGWEATRGETATILALAVISVVVFFLGSFVGDFVLGGFSILRLAWSLLFGWFAIMVGLSILTTLYGHYIEGRPLV